MNKSATAKPSKKTKTDAAIEDLAPKTEKEVRAGGIRMSDILISSYSVKSSD